MKIAFFDFDETLTTSDSLLEIIRFHSGKAGFYAGMALLSPWLIGLKLKIVSAQKAKEKLLAHFFGGMEENDFDRICRDFFQSRYPAMLNHEAADRLANLKKEGFEVTIVTASPTAWVKYWAEEMGAGLIGSEMEVKDGKITGKLKGKNCNYDEKVNRIKSVYDLEQYTEIHAYGDSKGDAAMLSIATNPFFRKFS